jgi:hypothetical protein
MTQDVFIGLEYTLRLHNRSWKLNGWVRSSFQPSVRIFTQPSYCSANGCTVLRHVEHFRHSNHFAAMVCMSKCDVQGHNHQEHNRSLMKLVCKHAFYLLVRVVKYVFQQCHRTHMQCCCLSAHCKSALVPKPSTTYKPT